MTLIQEIENIKKILKAILCALSTDGIDGSSYIETDPTVSAAIKSLTDEQVSIIKSLTSEDINNISQINNILELLANFGNTRAGITNRVYFTGDENIVDGTIYYKTSLKDKGTVNDFSQSIVVDDNEKIYFTNNFISIEQSISTVAPTGIYSGQLSVTNSSNQAQQQFYIDIYLYRGGTVVDSGVQDAEVGALGVVKVATLESGLLNIPSNTLTNITVSGFLTGTLSLEVGDRLLYVVAGEKIGTTGDPITLTLHSGSNFNTYYDVPVVSTTNNVLNRTSLNGIYLGDIIEYLKNNKVNVAGDLRGTATNPLVQKVTSEGHVVNEGIDWTTRTGGNQVISVQAKLDATTSTSDVAGGFMRFQTIGSNCNIDGLMIELSAGYTGNKTVRGINVHNIVAGGSTLNLLDESGTIGLSTQSQGQSTGDNIGIYSIAGFAQGRNIAGYFRAMQDNPIVSSTHQIGVMAIAGKHHNTLTGNFIGGYFGLTAYHDHRNFLDRRGALIANNGDIDASIFIGKSDGIDSFEVKSKGEVSITPSTNSVVPITVTAPSGQSTNLAYMSIGGVEKWRVSKSGDTIMSGRLLFKESGLTSYAQALYCENGSNAVVLRCGPTANSIVFKKSDASTLGGINGATYTFYWGSSFVNTTTFPVNGMIIEGNVGIGVKDPQSKLEVDGDIESINANGIILKDTVLGTRHRITLTNGNLVVSSAL